MLFSYRWLKELSGTKKTPEKLAELIMAHAFEVESVHSFEHGLSGVVIGKVMSVKPHPNADRLRIATVRTGKTGIHEIVCGAPNLATGQKVAVAMIGATLPGGIQIKAAELRGVSSQGMICSAKELGFGQEHGGILVLPADAPLGRDFVTYAELADVVLDVKILPDRSCDALSYQGLAREIAALEGGVAPFLVSPAASGSKLRKSTKVPKVSIKTDRSKRYLAVLMESVNLVSSPVRVQSRLILSGLRPMNAVVDVTNYLMLEMGQPVHAFDADTIPRGGLVVRQAKPREHLMLLDGTTLTLSKDDIVIADTKKPLALAGVMGGKFSGISENTKQVVFEIASFDAKSVRRTEKRHHLLTDAAYRYERGIDSDRPGLTVSRLAQYVMEWGMGQGVVVRDVNIGKSNKPTVIVLEIARLERLLGTQVPLVQVVQYCSWLGLSVKKIPKRTALRVTIPARRPDLRYPEDLIEEIGRLYGYHEIKPIPLCLQSAPAERNSVRQFERGVKQRLADMGFSEIMSYSFYGEKSLASVQIPQGEHLVVANPMNPEQAFMRASLFPGLYRALVLNAKHSTASHVFECGRVHRVSSDGPAEESHLALAYLTPSGDTPTDTFRQFKSQLETFFASLRISVDWNVLAAGTPPAFHPGRVGHLTTHLGTSLGFAGELEPGLSRRVGRGASVFFAEISLSVLAAQTGEGEMVFREFSRFPRARRDISLIGPMTVMYHDIVAVLREAGRPFLVDLELFDVFESGGEKSFAFHLSFGSSERTLSGEEMDGAFANMVAAASERLGYRLKM